MVGMIFWFILLCRPMLICSTEADNLRESGKSLEAIARYNESILSHQREGDAEGTFTALVGRILAWKHIFYQTEDPLFALMVNQEVEVLRAFAARHHLSRDHTVCFLAGQAAMLLNQYSLAEHYFCQAIAKYPLDNAEKGDWIAHLGDALIRNGKTAKGKNTVFQGIAQIQRFAGQTDSFLVHVWLSGAYLRLAETLDRCYLKEAKEIIDKDERLVIRKKQLEKVCGRD
jgi:hypothetical protein